MKFCTNCGHELFDDAVICTNCGRTVAGFSHNDVEPTVEPPKASKVDKESTIVSVFNFMSSLMSAVSMFFLLLTIAFASVYVHSYLDFDDYIYGVSVDTFAYISWGGGLSVLALIISSCAIALGITGLITSLLKHEKCKTVLSSILNIIIGGLLLTASIMFLVA